LLDQHIETEAFAYNYITKPAFSLVFSLQEKKITSMVIISDGDFCFTEFYYPCATKLNRM